MHKLRLEKKKTKNGISNCWSSQGRESNDGGS